jgi:trehalose 6-phosphate synthase
MSRLVVISNRVSPPSGAGGAASGGLSSALAEALREYDGCGSAGAGETTEHFRSEPSFRTSAG